MEARAQLQQGWSKEVMLSSCSELSSGSCGSAKRSAMSLLEALNSAVAHHGVATGTKASSTRRGSDWRLEQLAVREKSKIRVLAVSRAVASPAVVAK